MLGITGCASCHNSIVIVFSRYLRPSKNDAELSFVDVARNLSQVDGRHEFSFISKMLHTIDPSRPIYDSQVDQALQIHRT